MRIQRGESGDEAGGTGRAEAGTGQAVTKFLVDLRNVGGLEFWANSVSLSSSSLQRWKAAWPNVSTSILSSLIVFMKPYVSLVMMATYHIMKALLFS